jgi:uncharacterized membrane protein YidH (DUF202 family)
MVRLSLTDLILSPWLRALLGLIGFNLTLVAADLLLRLSLHQGAKNWQSTHLGLWASLLVVLGVLLILAGAVLDERVSWKENNVSLRPSQVRPVGHGSGLAFRADSIKSRYDPSTGLVRGGQTELTFLNANGVVGGEVLYDQTPSFFSGLMFHQLSTEPVLLIRATDISGHRLSLQSPETGASELYEVTLRFRDEEASRYIVVLGVPGQASALQFQQKGNQGYVLVPERDLSLRISFALPPQGEVDPIFQVEAFRGAETTAFMQVVVTSTASVEIGGDLYSFQPQRYALIQYGRDYSPVLFLLGGVLILIGLSLYAWHIARRQLTARKAAAVLGLLLAFAVAVWALTHNWPVAGASSSPISMPLVWWGIRYWVYVLACAAFAAASADGIVGWTRAKTSSKAVEPSEGSHALLIGMPLLTLLLLLGAFYGLYTRGVCWEWAQTESLRLVAWLFLVPVWLLHALLGWRGQRLRMLSILGVVPMLLCLLLPGR